jgi:hypothetical protein
LLSSILLKFWV